MEGIIECIVVRGEKLRVRVRWEAASGVLAPMKAANSNLWGSLKIQQHNIVINKAIFPSTYRVILALSKG